MLKTIENKIEYWKDLWKNLIDNFLKKSYGLNLHNPHILVEDIIIEIEENNFNNEENKKYFYSKLDYYYSTDFVIKNNFFSEFKILRTILHNPNKKNLILKISKEIEKKFKSGIFFDKNLEELKKILFDEKPLDKNDISKINYITENIITEFIKKGYILKDIQKFILYIFDNYKIIEGNENIINTYFPHNVSYSDFTFDGQLNREKFNGKIIEMMKSLSAESRIDKLSYYYYKEPKDSYYIFIVEGLKGNIDLNICDINFYSVNQKKYADEDFFDDEDLQKDQKNKFIQASVKVKLLSTESTLINALSKLENVIDLLHCYYNTKTIIKINTTKYIIIQDGKIIHRSWSKNDSDSFMKHINSLELNRYEKGIQKLNQYKYILSNKKDAKTHSKLTNAIHWFSKAEHSTKQADKILNYWISLENLINSEYEIIKNDLLEKNYTKTKLIQLIVSSNQIFSFIYEYGWEIYYHYSIIARNNHFPNIKLPLELIKKANLNTESGETIYLKKFIDSLEDIKKLETNLFLLEKLDNLISFYNDTHFTTRLITEQIKVIEDDILMIYRFRNLIVHNAHFDNVLLPYYVWKIREYSGNLIRSLMHKHKNDRIELSDLLLSTYLQKEKFMIELKNGKANLFAS